MITRDELLSQKASGAKWDVAVAIKRGNPLPLDESSLFASYEAALEYAQTSPIAYPTQIIGVVKADGTNEYYGITQNEQLEEIGGKVDVDDLSVVLEGEKISLKGYGKQYYRYVNVIESVASVGELPSDSAVGTFCMVEDVWYVKGANAWDIATEHPTDGNYILTQGFVAGLQPKVALNSQGKLELAWYQPSSTTVEGLSEQMSSITQTVDTMQQAVSEHAEKIADTYNKKEVDDKDKAIDDKVNTAIKSVVYDSASGKVMATKVDGTTAEMQLNDVAHGVSYDQATMKLTIPVFGQDDVVVNIPRDKFIRKGEYVAEYNFGEGDVGPALVLTVDNEDADTDEDVTEIAIPASALVDVYTGKTTSTAKVTVNDGNEISVDIAFTGITADHLISVDATGAPKDLGLTVVSSGAMGTSDTQVPVASVIASAIAAAVSAAQSDLQGKIDLINEAITNINSKLAKIYIGEGAADEIILSTTDGIKRSGKKVGGATLGETPDADTVATEAAVAAVMSWGTLG